MKWLFSTLVIANLGLLIWLLPQFEGAAERPSRLADIGQLQLVDENATTPDQEESQPAPGVSPQSASMESEPPLPPAQGDETSEQPAAEAVAEEKPREPVPEPPAVAARPVCGSLGVFDKRSDAELLSVKLRAEGVKTDITSEESNEQAGFWVLIPPQKSRDAAIAIAKRLEAAGVADLWRFTSGNLAHAISLGLFRDEERAIARRDLIADLGFNPEVRPRYREQTLYWLNYRYSGEPPLSEAGWSELSEPYPELERKEQPCH